MTLPRHTVVRRLLPGCAALALVGLVLSGCGGSSKASGAAGAAGTDGRAAQAFPATTVAFLDANIDEQSDAWKRLLALGARFPSFPKLVAEVRPGCQSRPGRRHDARSRCARLARHRGRGRRARRAGRRLRPRRCSASPRSRDRGGLEAQLKKEQGHRRRRDARRLRRLQGHDEQAPSLAISDDTALIGNSQAVVDASIDRLAGTGDKPLRQLRLQGHARDACRATTSSSATRPARVAAEARGATRSARARRSGRRAVTQAQLEPITAQLEGVRSIGFSMDATDAGLRMRTTTLLDGTQHGHVRAVRARAAHARARRARGSRRPSAASATRSRRRPTQALAANPAAQKQVVTQVETMLGIKLDDVYALFSGETSALRRAGRSALGRR